MFQLKLTNISFRHSGVPSAHSHSNLPVWLLCITSSLLRSSKGIFVACVNNSQTTTPNANISLLVVYSSSCIHSGASHLMGNKVLRCLKYSRLYLSLLKAGYETLTIKSLEIMQLRVAKSLQKIIKCLLVWNFYKKILCKSFLYLLVYKSRTINSIHSAGNLISYSQNLTSLQGRWWGGICRSIHFASSGQ